MIQRKQSLWLFLAALVNAGLFYFCLYAYHTLVNGIDTIKKVRVAEDFASFVIALVITLLPLVTIFMFKNRKRQINLSLVTFLGIVCFITITLWRVGSLSKQLPPPTDGSYRAGAVLPVVAFVFVFLAIIGIRKDNKLVKSADRLR